MPLVQVDTDLLSSVQQSLIYRDRLGRFLHRNFLKIIFVLIAFLLELVILLAQRMLVNYYQARSLAIEEKWQTIAPEYDTLKSQGRIVESKRDIHPVLTFLTIKLDAYLVKLIGD